VEFILNCDSSLFLAINGLLGQALWLDSAMVFLTNANVWRIAGGILAVVLLIWGDNPLRRTVIAAALALVIADITAFNVLKPIFCRPRPGNLLSNVIILAPAASYCGFPSNHAANMMALAITFTLRQQRPWSYILIPVAIVVGFTRIWVGVHFPLDVLGGWLWGVLIGWLGAVVVTILEKNCGWSQPPRVLWCPKQCQRK
jgi:undecaprenyl-diphosphatase